jgi:hypothetical protein
MVESSPAASRDRVAVTEIRVEILRASIQVGIAIDESS